MTLKAERDALHAHLMTRPWSHWVSLAFNDPEISTFLTDIEPVLMRDRVKEWDARMNRKIIGPKWQRRPDERMFWFLTPEALDRNPHLHGYVYVRPDQRLAFDIHAALTWETLCPKGSAEIETFDLEKAKPGYATKQTFKRINFENFILSRELIH